MRSRYLLYLFLAVIVIITGLYVLYDTYNPSSNVVAVAPEYSISSTISSNIVARLEGGNDGGNDPLLQQVLNPDVMGVIHNLSNVVLDGGRGRSKHHVYTAYYDSRHFPSRPAVVLLGYVERRSKVSLYCKFYYVDNTTKCAKQEAGEAPIIAFNVWPEFYFCKMSGGDQVPTHVSLSKDSHCDTAHWSHPIPVWNREPPVPAPEGVGVCVHGCLRLYDADRMFQYIMEYLAMVKTLGAKIVTLYQLNMNPDMLQKVLYLYPEFVDIVRWFYLNNTLHSNGQRVLLNDCIYRNMHRVKYLVMMDLDEMIFPVSTNNWPDMIRGLERKGKFASFTFSNNFFAEVNESIATKNRICPLLNEPRYFHRLQRLPWPDFKQRTKTKMIIKPAVVSASCTHDLCRPTLSGYGRTYKVSMSDAVMAHYRVPVPRWYIYGEGVQDRTALKYRDPVEAELRGKCSLLMRNSS